MDDIFQLPLKKDSADLNSLIETRARTAGSFWVPPYGEPLWCVIPAGKFLTRDADDGEPYEAALELYFISTTPITNAQYALFVHSTQYTAPIGWKQQQPPPGKENHPVVFVNWFDVTEYCRWLSKSINRRVTLPTIMEWEKAVHGDLTLQKFSAPPLTEGQANTLELGLNDTTPVGIFPESISPYGVLDMRGNVWEWMLSRGSRGGSWQSNLLTAQSYNRYTKPPTEKAPDHGFRVVLHPSMDDYYDESENSDSLWIVD